jgi:hypothetical protein
MSAHGTRVVIKQPLADATPTHDVLARFDLHGHSSSTGPNNGYCSRDDIQRSTRKN